MTTDRGKFVDGGGGGGGLVRAPRPSILTTFPSRSTTRTLPSKTRVSSLPSCMLDLGLPHFRITVSLRVPSEMGSPAQRPAANRRTPAVTTRARSLCCANHRGDRLKLFITSSRVTNAKLADDEERAKDARIGTLGWASCSSFGRALRSASFWFLLNRLTNAP